MWNEPTRETLGRMPKLYETENIPLEDKLIHLHFFIGGCDWYVVEYDGDDLFWGFAILNNDYEMAEWGYVSLRELKSIKVQGWLEVDCELEDFWQVKRAVKIDKIRRAQGWPKEKKGQDIAKEDELLTKVKAGHFQHFQDFLAEVTSTHSDYFGIDPYRIWEAANGHEAD